MGIKIPNNAYRPMQKQIVIRLTDSDYLLIKEISHKRGENISSFVRRAVRRELAQLGFLDNSTRRALGLEVET
jgi:uncharacterized protein (DUF1778 family)